MTQVTAQVVLRAPDGSSVLDAAEPPTAETVERYRPNAETFEKAGRRLAELGFRVGDRGASGLTVSGEPKLFERVFSTTLDARGEGEGVAPSWEATRPVIIPDDLASFVAGVVFPIAPIFLGERERGKEVGPSD